jgi:hypothetical protein
MWWFSTEGHPDLSWWLLRATYLSSMWWFSPEGHHGVLKSFSMIKCFDLEDKGKKLALFQIGPKLHQPNIM